MQRCRSLSKLMSKTIPLRLSPVAPLKVSKLKSKTGRASRPTSSIWFLQTNSWRVSMVSQTTIFRKSPPYTWCFLCGEASLSPPSTTSPRSKTATRWDDAGVMPICTPIRSNAPRSATTPTTCASRRGSNRASPPLLRLQGSFLLNPSPGSSKFPCHWLEQWRKKVIVSCFEYTMYKDVNVLSPKLKGVEVEMHRNTVFICYWHEAGINSNYNVVSLGY